MKALKINKKIYLLSFLSFIILTQCNMNKVSVNLQGNWTPKNKKVLEKIISSSANQNQFAVFDFDNTTLCRDIGEATLEQLVLDNKIETNNTILGLSPAISQGDSFPGIIEYYEALLGATNHQENDEMRHSNGYVWATQVLSGLNLNTILAEAEKAFDNNSAAMDLETGAESKLEQYVRPFFYPEMVDLIGNLLKNGIDVYIISASNVWTVRYLVLNHLNGILNQKYGVSIKPENVFGISTLMRNTQDGKLYKDAYLVQTNKAYAKLEKDELKKIIPTVMSAFPLSAYAGKTATILQFISSQKPLIVAGDSPNDIPMMRIAKNRLWIERLDKKDYKKKILNENFENILFQPTLNKENAGFKKK